VVRWIFSGKEDNTNQDFTAWGEFLRDETVAVPIVDRLIHHSHVFMLGGESYRLKQKTA